VEGFATSGDEHVPLCGKSGVDDSATAGGSDGEWQRRRQRIAAVSRGGGDDGTRHERSGWGVGCQ
jgi:hypothetical protein